MNPLRNFRPAIGAHLALALIVLVLCIGCDRTAPVSPATSASARLVSVSPAAADPTPSPSSPAAPTAADPTPSASAPAAPTASPAPTPSAQPFSLHVENDSGRAIVLRFHDFFGYYRDRVFSNCALEPLVPGSVGVPEGPNVLSVLFARGGSLELLIEGTAGDDGLILWPLSDSVKRHLYLVWQSDGLVDVARDGDRWLTITAHAVSLSDQPPAPADPNSPRC